MFQSKRWVFGCPYCGKERPIDWPFGCCGESSAHFMWLGDQAGEVVSDFEMQTYRLQGVIVLDGCDTGKESE